MKTYDFRSGCTDPASFPAAHIAEYAVKAINEVGIDFARYPGELGHLGLREVMAERESQREGVDVSPDNISLMNGSMQPVTLIAEALMERSGDIIITEELTYSGTLSIYKSLGAQLVGIPMDEHGMKIDALEKTLQELHAKGTPPRFIYTLPTYHNPTGILMPKSRRLELIDVALKYNTVVVDDNCYGDVHFEGEKEPSLHALSESPNIIYLCSLSKILGPGLRLGYLIARQPMLDRIMERRFDGGNSLLAASVCAAYLKDNLWDYVTKANLVLKEKRDAVYAGLESSVSDICTWSHPVGGIFIWVQFPSDVDRLKLEALLEKEGILYGPGSAYHVNEKDIPYLRLAFGYCSLDDIHKCIPLVGQAIRASRKTRAQAQAAV